MNMKQYIIFLNKNTIIGMLNFEKDVSVWTFDLNIANEYEADLFI